MIHTELDLPTHIYQDIERMAEAAKRPTAQVLRELIDMGVERWHLRQDKSGQRETPATPNRTLDKLAHFGFKGPKDLAIHLDDYLYGDEQ